jgi:hypothetical protein
MINQDILEECIRDARLPRKPALTTLQVEDGAKAPGLEVSVGNACWALIYDPQQKIKDASLPVTLGGNDDASVQELLQLVQRYARTEGYSHIAVTPSNDSVAAYWMVSLKHGAFRPSEEFNWLLRVDGESPEMLCEELIRVPYTSPKTAPLTEQALRRAMNLHLGFGLTSTESDWEYTAVKIRYDSERVHVRAKRKEGLLLHRETICNLTYESRSNELSAKVRTNHGYDAIAKVVHDIKVRFPEPRPSTSISCIEKVE